MAGRERARRAAEAASGGKGPKPSPVARPEARRQGQKSRTWSAAGRARLRQTRPRLAKRGLRVRHAALHPLACCGGKERQASPGPSQSNRGGGALAFSDLILRSPPKAGVSKDGHRPRPHGSRRAVKAALLTMRREASSHDSIAPGSIMAAERISWRFQCRKRPSSVAPSRRC